MAMKATYRGRKEGFKIPKGTASKAYDFSDGKTLDVAPKDEAFFVEHKRSFTLSVTKPATKDDE